MASHVLSKAFPVALKEIRVHFSPAGAQSAGMRSFVESKYRTIKQHNPKLPFLIREADDVPARFFLRFAEKSAFVDGLDAAGVERKLQDLLRS
ncbi:hypothetical protein MSPP1_001194 [Malassezia sp. CBS 17886]|nr:hypothetical protein MSPP1_001194 [Malassezia sp. CBS 17886]